MIRAVLIFFALATFSLVSFWAQYLRQQNQELKLKVKSLEKSLEEEKSTADKLNYENLKYKGLTQTAPAPPSGQAAAMKLASERQRLTTLKKNLSDLMALAKDSPSGQADSHIAEDNATIADLEGQLTQVNGDGTIVSERAKLYRDEQNARLYENRIALKAQIQNTNDSIHLTQSQIESVRKDRRDPNRAANLQQLNAQLADLRTLRAQQDAQNVELDARGKKISLAITEEVRSEQGEVKNDREQMRRELAQRRSDLGHWKKVKAEQSAAQRAQDQKLQSARADVYNQTAVVKALESVIPPSAGR